MSTEPSTRLTVPSAFTLAVALEGPALLNQKPLATPRPRLATLQGRGVVLMLLGSLNHLQVAYAGEHGAGDSPCAFLRSVEGTKFQGVHANLFAYLVNDGFSGEGGGRGAGRSVGSRLGLVQHHVVPFDAGVGDVVGAKDALAAGVHGRPGKGAGLIGQVGFRRSDAPIFGGAHLHPHVAAGGGAAPLEHLGPAHGQLHRLPGLPGEKGGDRLQVNQGFPSKATSDLHRNSPDLGDGDAKDVSRLVPYVEMALAAGPEGEVAVGAPECRGGVGFDVALVNGRRAVLALDDDVGLLEPLLQVPRLEDEVVGYVAALVVYHLLRSADLPAG